MHYSGKEECRWWLTDDEASPISVPVLVGKFRLLRLGSGFRAGNDRPRSTGHERVGPAWAN